MTPPQQPEEHLSDEVAPDAAPLELHNEPLTEPYAEPHVAEAGPVAPPPRPKRRGLRPWHYLFIGMAIPIVLLVGFALLMNAIGGALMGSGMMPAENEYVVTRVEVGETVTLPGTIEPTQRLDLSFTSRGEVTGVNVVVGDSVTPGQVLATIDDADLRGAVTDARAEANAAWKDYQDARRSGSSAAVSAMRSAHAVRDQALKEAEEALKKASLTSTIDGVVAAVNVQTGQIAGDGASAMSDPTGGSGASGQADVVVISRSYQVKASVGSAERSRLAKDMPATVTTSSATEPLRGTVTSIGVVAESTPSFDGRPSAATFPLIVTLDGEPENVFVGSAATIEVQAGSGEPVLAIPQDALLFQDSETEATVQVRREPGAPAEDRRIQIGRPVGDMLPVTSGLSEGDIVVYMQWPGAEAAVQSEEAQPAEPPR